MPSGGIIVLTPSGDGSDDALLINAALSDPSVTTVQLGAGTFSVQTPIFIPSGKTLLGAGTDDTLIKATDNFSVPSNQLNGVVMSELGATDVTLSDLSVDANKVRPGDIRLNGVFMKEAVDFSVSDVNVYNATGYAQFAQGNLAGFPATSEYATGTFENCGAFNSNVCFEQMFADGVTLTNCVAGDGDGDIAIEAYFHALAGSRNISYIGSTAYGNAQHGIDIASIVDPASNIQIIDCDIEITRADSGLALIASATLPTFDLIISDSRFVSHGYAAAMLGGVTGTATNSVFEGVTTGILFQSSSDGTPSDYTVVDSSALGLGDPTGTATAYGVIQQGGSVLWQGGSIEARGPEGLMSPLGGPVTLSGGTTLITRGFDLVDYYLEGDTTLSFLRPSASALAGFGAFSGGGLTIEYQAGGTADDRLAILSTGTGPGQISVIANVVFYQGAAFATFSGGAGGVPLQIAFGSTANATAAAVEALTRALIFSNGSDNPSAPIRLLSARLVDGAGHAEIFSAALAVVPVDDAPNLDVDGGGGDTVSLQAQGSADVAVAPQAMISDPDSSDFTGARLRVEIVSGSDPADQLTISDQVDPDLRVDGSGNLLYKNVVIGTVSPGTGGATPLLVTLNENATLGAVQAMLDAVAFRTADGDTTAREIRLSLEPGFAASLIGTGAAETIAGDGRANILVGFGGNDVLDGAGGADRMAGETGDDIYYVDSSRDLVVETAGEGRDSVYTSVSYSLAPGSHVEVLAARTATATDMIHLTGNELAQAITGNDGTNTLRGGGGADTLAGLGGNDTLNGGAGADVMSGGAGNDTYLVDDRGDVIIEAAAAGYDVAYASASYTLLSDAEVEFLATLSAAGVDAINLTGSGSANTILGNQGRNILKGEGGADTLVAYSGDDTLNGGSGADVMNGGAGNDTYVVDNRGDVVAEITGGGYDAVYTSVSYTLDATAAVEFLSVLDLASLGTIDLVGSNFANTLVGSDGRNTLLGGGGADTLIGHGGHDTLNGGADADILNGGAGNDTYLIDDRGDVVVEGAGAGYDAVYTSITYTLAASAEIEFLSALSTGGSAAMNLTGNYLANTVYGNQGRNTLKGEGGADTLVSYAGDDTLNGGAGIDVMNGGIGNDTYIVDTIGDVVVDSAGQGYDAVYAGTSYVLSAGAEVEYLATLSATLADPIDLAGNEFANKVAGNNGRNTLSGGGGADTLIGNGDDDVLDGGAGADLLNGGAGADTFRIASLADSGAGAADRIVDFQSGTDRIDLSLIDANAGTAGDQEFSWIGGGAFTNSAGELRFVTVGQEIRVFGDVDGNGTADFQIDVVATSLTASDFIF